MDRSSFPGDSTPQTGGNNKLLRPLQPIEGIAADSLAMALEWQSVAPS
jgi:hypothetical protein